MTMAGMSEWWDGRRDQHLSILGALTGLSAMIGLASIFVLGFSSNGPLEIGVPIMTRRDSASLVRWWGSSG